jgi:hypothetical protein
MTQRFDEEGNITTLVGDTILFDINDVPTDLDYTIFFRVYDNDNNAVIPEVVIPANFNSTVTIEVKPYVTDMVLVPSGKKSVKYFYGIKACNLENQVEHTQTVDGVDLNQETTITFLRKRVEGFYYYGTLYPWVNNGVYVYTNTETPTVGAKIYTSQGLLTNDTVSSVVTEDDEITGIVVSEVTYSKPEPEPEPTEEPADTDTDTDEDNNG